jgi:hypothetical protein
MSSYETLRAAGTNVVCLSPVSDNSHYVLTQRQFQSSPPLVVPPLPSFESCSVPFLFLRPTFFFVLFLFFPMTPNQTSNLEFSGETLRLSSYHASGLGILPCIR